MVYKLSPAGSNAAMLGSIYPLRLGVNVSAFLPRFKIVSRIAPVTPIFSSCQDSPYSKSLSLLVRVILCLLETNRLLRNRLLRNKLLRNRLLRSRLLRSRLLRNRLLRNRLLHSR